MKYAYEDLSPEQFEGLIIFICQELLGIGVQGFSTGPDGGRDARFSGTAELHPSKSMPWQGTVIIQAKHTNGYNRHFMETDFFSQKSQKTIIGKEIERVKKLKNDNKLDYYMLFSNRRLAGNAEDTIRLSIADSCEIDEASIFLCGIEQLELYLKTFPAIVRKADIDPIDSPLIVSPNDLAEVIQALAPQIDSIEQIIDDEPTPRITYSNKNEVNKMSTEYADELRKRYLKETAQIQKFLSAPENYNLLKLYESVVDEFQLKIVSKRKSYQTFDELMEYLLDLLFKRDPILRQTTHKRLTRSMLFYMYWNCDIGQTENA